MHVQLRAEQVDCSAVFLLKKRIPAKVLDSPAKYDFSKEHQLELIDLAIKRLCPENRR
jgi:hypothetical protein